MNESTCTGPAPPASNRPRAAISWSGGKDSCLALLRAREQGFDVTTFLTMCDDDGTSKSHALPPALLAAQVEALGGRWRAERSGFADYGAVFAGALRSLREEGHTHMVFGDIDLAAHRDWLVPMCEQAGLAPVFPLWGESRASLAREVLARGIRARIVCVDTRWLDESFCGVEYDAALLARLPEGVCPVGEDGEFHTFVFAAPGFATALPIRAGAPRRIRSTPPFAPTTYVMQSLELQDSTVPVRATRRALPKRIACLSTEAVEVLYRLGARDRIVGISGYSVYPPEARLEKAKVSGFSTVRMDKLLALAPDLVIGFSDLQRPWLDRCAEAGLDTLWFDQRSLAGIHAMLVQLGRVVGEEDAAGRLSSELQRRQDDVAEAAARLPRRPRVYFEEWDAPMICGIGWVSEMIALAGGTDVFAAKAVAGLARDRFVSADEVLAAAPELIVGSWCGKRFAPQKVRDRPGFAALGATLVEIKSADILSPGPAAIERGLPQLFEHISRCVEVRP